MTEAQKLKQAIPATLQFELGLLLRTLEILKSFDEDEDTESKSSIIEFFEKMVNILSRVPSLTLSAYWDEKYGCKTEKKVNIVGIPVVANNEIDNGGEPYIFDVPEIEYLKENKVLEPTKEMAEKHDPLRLIQNLYDTACGCFSSSSITTSDRDILITICLLIALKSGRASYLLHTAWIISSIDDDYIGVEMTIFEEFFAHLKQSNLALDNTLCRIKEDAVKLQKPEQLVPLQKRTVINRTPRTFLFSFGKADHGKLGHGDTQLNRLVPTLVEALDHVSIVKMASMSTYAVAIDRSGNVFVWGTGGSSNSVVHLSGGSQQAKTDIIPQLLEALPPKAHVIDVSCGLGHALFLLNNGKVFSWGNGGNGRLGLGDLADRTEATLVTELSNDVITAVQCGASHSLALSDKGKVFSWGKNTQGQCGQASNDDILRPHVIKKLFDLHHVVVQLAAGWEHSLALTADGKLFSWGSGYKDSRRGVIPPVLGLGHNECRTSPECITSIDSVKITRISCGWDHCLALDSTGKILSWGSGQNGKLGQGSEDNISIPCYIPFFEKLPSKTVHISAGCEHSAAITEDGSMFSWGHGDGGRLGHGDNSPCFTPAEIFSIKEMNVKPTYIHCGDKFTMLLAQAKPSSEDDILNKFGVSNKKLDRQSIYSNTQYFAALPKNVDSIVRFTEFKLFLDSNDEYFKQANISCLAEKPSSSSEVTTDEFLFQKKSISRMHVLSVLLYSMAKASLRTSTRCAQKSIPVESIALSVKNLDAFCLNNSRRLLMKAWSTDATVDNSFLFDEVMTDAEYAIENSDATMGNISKLIEYFFILYSSNLDSLINRKSDLATKHALLDDVSAGESTSNVIDDSQLEESFDSVGSAELQLGENTNKMEANEGRKDSKTKEDILQEIQLNVEGSGSRIMSSFEMLYSTIVIFSANIEVLSNAQHNAELRNGLKELSMSLMRQYGLQRSKECDDGGTTNREKRKKRFPNDAHNGTNTSATAESYYAYDGSETNSNAQYVEYESEHSASVTEYSDEDSQSLSQSQSLSLAPSTSRRRPRKNDEYDEEGDEGEGDGEGENSVGEDSDYGRNTASMSGDSQVQRQVEPNRVHSLKSAASPTPGKRRSSESKSSSDVQAKDSSVIHGYESDDSQTSQLSNGRAMIQQQQVSSSSYDNAYEHGHGVGIAMGSADGMESNYQNGNSATIDFSTRNENDQNAYYMNISNPGDMDYGNTDELADSVEMQRAIIYSMQKEDPSAYSSLDVQEMSNTNEDMDDSNKVYSDMQRFQRVQEDLDTNAVSRIRDVLNSLASQCYMLVDRNNTSNIFDCPLRSYCDKYCDSSTATKYYGSMQTIFLVWESAQIVTSRGFYALYNFSDRCTVVCQVIQSPSSFLYIIPGLVNGVLDSALDCTQSGSENKKVHNILVETLLSGILRVESDGFESDEDAHASPPFLTWENIIDLVRFIQKDINDKKGSAQHCDYYGSANSNAEVKYIDKYSFSASKMQELISTSLIKLFYSILSTMLDKLFSGSHYKFRNRSTNVSEDCEVPFPCAQLDKLLFNIVECIAADVSAIFTKLKSTTPSVLTATPAPSFVKHSFTSQILLPMIEKFLPLDVVKITVSLPHILKLATAFHSSYNECASTAEPCRNVFRTWLQDTFLFVFHFCADMAHFLLQPEITATKLFRKFNQANSHYLVTARYERSLNGGLLSKSSEEYNLWTSLHRIRIPTVSNYSDLKLTAMDELSDDKKPINSFSGVLHSSILLSDQVCCDLLTRYGVLSLLLRSVSPNYDSVDFLKPAYSALLSQTLNSAAHGSNNSTKIGEICLELRKLLLSLLVKSRMQESAYLQNLLLKADEVLERCGGDMSKVELHSFLSNSVLQEFVNIVVSSFVYTAIILLECDMMQSNNNQKLHWLTKVVEKCHDLVTTSYSLELIPNFIESGFLAAALLLLPQEIPTDESLVDAACLRPALTDLLTSRICSFRQQFESKYPYIFKNQSSFSKLRASIKSQFYSSTVIKEEFLLGSKTKSFINTRKLNTTNSKETNVSVAVSFLSLILVDNVSVSVVVDAAIHDEIVKRSKFQGLAVVLYSLLQLKDCKILTQKFAEKFTLEVFEKVAEDLEFFKSFPDCMDVVPTVSTFAAIFNTMDLFVADRIHSVNENGTVDNSNLESNLIMISDLLSLLLVSYSLVSLSDHVYRFETPMSVHAFMETFQYVSKTSNGLAHDMSGDATVMKSYKQMCLLQSVLRNFTLIYRVQPSVIDKWSASPTTVVETKEGDADSVTHKFLYNICCIFGPLGALLKTQMASFYRHLSFCKNVGVKYLSSAIKPIELSSPSILSNVFSPQGCFSIGFWLYIPSNYVALSKPNSDKKKIHILSRIPETGDVNLVSLLRSDDNPINHSLSAHLLEENGNFGIVLNAVVLDSDTNSTTRSKAFKKLELKSNCIPRDNWVSCVIELTQEIVGGDPLNRESSGWVATQLSSQQKEKTTIALFINGALERQLEIEGGRSPLHQNIVIGKIPSRLSDDTASSSFDIILSGPNNGGRQHTAESHILIADVFWIPTSIFLDSSSMEHKNIIGILRSKLQNSDDVTTTTQVEPSKDESETQRCDFYDIGIPQCPPTYLLQSIDQLFNCSTKLLDIVSILFSNEITKENAQLAHVTRSVMFTPSILMFACEVLCVANIRTQEAAFKAVRMIFDAIVFIEAASGPSVGTSLEALVLSVHPAGSAVHFASLQKVFNTTKECVNFATDLVADLLNESSTQRHVELPSKLVESKDLWLQRLRLCRSSVEKAVRVIEWGYKITIDANVILTGAAGLICSAPGKSNRLPGESTWFDNLVEKSVEESKGKSKYNFGSATLIATTACGGWFPQASVNRTVDLTPRKLFLRSDPRGFDCCIFPSTAVVMHAANTLVRPNNGIWLKESTSAYFLSDTNKIIKPLPEESAPYPPEGFDFNCIFPQTSPGIISATELTPVKDPFIPMSLIAALADRIVLKSAHALLEILKLIVSVPVAPVTTVALTNTLANIPNKKKKNLSLTKGRSLQSLDIDITSSPLQIATSLPSGKETGSPKLSVNQPISNSDSNSYCAALMQQVSSLRCILVQATIIDSQQQLNSAEGILLFSVIKRNLRQLISLSSLDPVNTVCNIFQASPFKGVQLDVLKNLLKEGDIPFLEKISLRLWKQFRCSKSDVGIHPSGSVDPDLVNSLVQLTALAGEVAISDTKVRALTHFPSVRLSGVALERMTGRWFYEVTLLSDGLMQLGWANSLFRCDPICGQGVGDHIHSWAYDGLRSKKWNVSCEAYGRRWRLGDTVGVLVDMDLLEMRFFLNGEDLGPAFEDFSAYELHPALSLNVRQCVRLNFGQFKFLHPPNEVDGKPFKPVVSALIAKYQHHQHIAGPSLGPASPKAILSPKKNTSVAAPSFSITRNDDSPQHPSQVAAASSGAETSRQQQQQLIMNRIMRPNSSSLSGRPRPGSAMRPITSAIATDAVTSSASAVTDASAGGIALSTAASNSSTATAENLAIGIATSARQKSANNEEVGEIKDRNDAESSAESPWKEDTPGVSEREMQEKLIADEGDDEDDDDEDEQIDADADNDGRDEDGDDDDDGEDDEEGDGEGDEEDNENDDENEESSHLNELRRQAMIESLIGMGFPVDWALRAAEHCDVTTSESAAISWIIERMELEQSKMDDIEGDSSRVADEEEFEEAEESGLDYFMQRHAAAFNALNGSAAANANNSTFSGNAPSGQSSAASAVIAMRERVSELSHNLNMLTGNENVGMSTQMQMQLHMSELEAAAAAVGNSIGLTSGSAISSGMQAAGSGSLANGSPTRDEGLGVRRGILLPGAATGMNDTKGNVHGSAGSKYVYSKLVDGKDGRDHKPIHSGNYDVDDIFGGYIGNSFTWNTGAKYPPVLVGQYTARRRHDLDKQEVLTQVSELDISDILPILASCEFALCIYYSRAILLRMLNHLTSSSSGHSRSGAAPMASLEELGERRSQRSPTELLCSEILFQAEASKICEFLKSCFKQYITMNIYQPDRLFPHIYNGNSAGDVIEKLPPFAPFCAEATIEFNRVLSALEVQLFSTSRQSLAAEESSLQSLQSLSNFLRLLMTNSYGNVDKLKSIGGSFTQSSSNENNGGSSISSSFSDLQDQVLRGVGVNLNTNSGPTNSTVAAGITRGMLVSRYSLNYVIRHCLQSFELAISERWEGSTDWILSGMEREDYSATAGPISSVEMEDNIAYKVNYENSQFSTYQTPAQLLEHQQNLSIKSPPVLWAYWVLRQLLANSIRDCIAYARSILTFIPDLNLYFPTIESSSSKDDQCMQSAKGLEADFLVLSDYVNKLCLLLKVMDSRMYKNSAVEVATHPQTVQRLLNILSGSNSASLKVLLFEIIAGIISGLNIYFEFVLAYSSIYHKSMTRSVDEPLYATLPWLSQADFEQLIVAKVSIARELSYFMSRDMKLMNPFSSALKAEGRLGCRRLTRKYTRAVSYLLFEAVQLHRNLSLYAECQPGSESSNYAQVDSYQQYLRLGHPREESELKVTQLSSSSITMNWKVKQETPLHLSQEHSQWSWCLYISVAGLGLGMDGLPAPTPDFEDEPVLIAANIDSVGSFRIDDLESDTMYRISIRLMYRTLTDINSSSDSNEEEDSSEETSFLYVATECEAPFRFDPENMSPNISLCGSGNLTIRNNANKKWSTVRANKRMSSGLHRWDVMIDRCISKNIFIGVASKEARLDNYVGCDKYGWAFLANKAVWHNKSKSKAYGELFRTGDLITVILDMDAGQLSFLLNDRPLGVAMDGLVGPLYPAFSLYNEDDQLTIKQVKSKASDGSSFRGDTSKDHGIGTCMAEGLFSRIVALDDLLGFIGKDYNLSNSAYTAIRSASPDLSEDLFHRYSHMFVGAGYRSVEIAPFDIQTLYTSSSACLSFSEGRLGLGQVVLVDKKYYRVSGVSAHKMWLQYLEPMKGIAGPSDPSTQEPEVDMIGLSYDELNSMLLSALLVAVDIATEQISQRGNLTNSMLLSHVNGALVTEGQPDPEFALSKEDFANKLNSKWTKTDDDVVFRYLTLLYRRHSNDPFRLGFQQLCDFSFVHSLKANAVTHSGMQNSVRDVVTETTEGGEEKEEAQEKDINGHQSEANLQLLLSMRSLLGRRSEAEVVQRMVLFLHLNDCIRPLLSILSPYSAYPSSFSSEGPINFPSAKLRDVRDILFPTVKYEFARSLTQGYAAEHKIGCVSTPPLSRPFIMSRAAAADNEKGRDDDAGVGRLILEVEDENMKCEKLLQLATSTSTSMAGNSPMGSLAALVISRDSHWNLIAAVQTSLIGQFMAYLEVLGTLNSCNPQVFCSQSSSTPTSTSTKGDENNKLQNWARSNGGAWECILRNDPMPSKVVSDGRKVGSTHLQDNNLAYRQFCSVPIHIRSISCCVYKNMMSSAYDGPEGSDDGKISKSLLLELANDRQLEYHRCSRLFRLLQIAEGTMNMNYYHLGSLDGSGSGPAAGLGFAVSEWQLFAVFVEETCKQVQRLVDAVFKSSEVMAEIDAGELNIILQLLYATGSLVGLGLRTGVSFQLRLPPSFYRIVAGCPDLDPTSGQGSAAREEDISKAAALALRHGIVSIYPEPALDLLSFEDVCAVFEGDVPLGGDLTAAYLYRHSIYGELVSAEDLHIQYFWAVMYELSEQQLRSFIYNLVFPLHTHSTSSSSSGSSSGGLSNTSNSGTQSASTSSAKFPSNRLGPVDFLSFASYATFCQYVTPSRSGLDTKDSNLSNTSSSRPRPIIAPTALALLSPDNADITVFEFTNKKSVSESPYLTLKISIPRYSTLQIMAEKVLQLVNLSMNMST